ncbi:MAG: peptide chain release factor N(5)-glutamine methyltransferase [Hyphomicrobium sp.]|nr:peptide chain release factor N(5)-glutamine methyltransferase [Hyphomicrobium sp.]
MASDKISDLFPDATVIGDARRILARRLSDAGFEDAVRDARRLVEIATGRGALEAVRDDRRPLTDQERERLGAALQRRLRREPVSRIAGQRSFYGRDFVISPAVLDPRPDTETLVECALACIRGGQNANAAVRVLDIGTGSGCILLTLLAELPGAVGVGIDVSPEALDVASKNATRHGLADRVTFRSGDVLVSDIAVLEVDRFDLIVSNPPYIPTAEVEHLDEDVKGFDPRLALDGGPDGLAFYRAIAAALARAAGQRIAVLEVGAGQADAVRSLMLAQLGERLAWSDVRVDLGGHTRCVAVATHF